MTDAPREIEELIDLMAKLPGLGPRSARRAVLYLIRKRGILLHPLGRQSGFEPLDQGIGCRVEFLGRSEDPGQRGGEAERRGMRSSQDPAPTFEGAPQGGRGLGPKSLLLVGESQTGEAPIEFGVVDTQNLFARLDHLEKGGDGFVVLSQAAVEDAQIVTRK